MCFLISFHWRKEQKSELAAIQDLQTRLEVALPPLENLQVRAMTRVTATLATGHRKRMLERIRLHLSEQIFLAGVRDDRLWRIGAILGRDTVIKLKGKG